MQRNVVAYRYFVFQNRFVRTARDMYHCSVLNISTVADSYEEDIAAQYRVEPDGGLLAYVHIANNLRALFDECSRMNLRMHTAKRSDHSTTLYCL